ncbi:MAG: hypothetical protein SPJ92_06415 [Bariatricus sp.]|nr:hypothetical protein [Bariatricus sp.]
MTEKTEYAVLKFVEQNGYCHMISDYVNGISIMQYVQEEYPISKECLWHWMAEIARQLEQYYKWEDQNAYGFVNPYAVIVSEESNLMLLDAADPASEEQVRKMQKKKIRTLFVKKERIFTQKAVLEDDIYGLGKTFQFMLEKCRLTEKLTRREKWLVTKVIEKCLRGKRTGIRMTAEIQADLRGLSGFYGKTERSEKRAKTSSKRWKILVGIGFAAAFMIAGILLGEKQFVKNRVEAEEESADQLPEEEDENTQGNEKVIVDTKQSIYDGVNQAYLELGVMYLVELDDYDEGRGYLEEAAKEMPLGKVYLTIFEYLKRGGSENFIRTELEENLQNGREILEEPEVKEFIKGKEYWYKIPFVMTYGMLGTQEAWKEMTAVGEKMEQEILWSEENRNKEMVLRKYLAKAYEMEQDYDRAAEECERLKELEETKEGLEEIYLSLERIYDEKGDPERSWEICRESIERIPDSEKIWLSYLEKHLKDVGIERQVCAEAVKKALEQLPDFSVNTEFVKLQKQYEIRIEGENVWVGK